MEISQNGTPNSNIESCAHAIVPLFDLETEFVCVNVGEQELRLSND